ncbi:TIGR02117 family protein [Pontibacter silvestris]|uniref:TIGR02117 family protein n=2 Tax=Pontibacter silvestris TaxID=2305183 RepID=A0ABW4X276_9BACT|nr:TIGR02117 family protein [Pontibacter silvestris]MCC9138315.1 TIGR02117 family protein [Pontibacter silvestris]
MVKKWRSGCLYSLVSGVSLVFLFLLLMLLLGSIPVNKGFAQHSQGIEIFVTDNGIHTDLILPVKTKYIDWRTKLPLQQYKEADSSYQYIAFGWGDHRFYMETPTWKDLKPGVAVTALFWPTRSAMHVSYAKKRLEPNNSQQPLILSEQQYQGLVQYIVATFQQQNKEFILINGAGYTGKDNFYKAHGHFYLFRNCNNWTNRGLKEAGVKTAVWAPLPFAIMQHLR